MSGTDTDATGQWMFMETGGKPTMAARRSFPVLRMLAVIAVILLLVPAVAYAAVPLPRAGFGQSFAPGGSWGTIITPPPARQFSGTTDFTLEAWVKPSAGGGGGTIYFTPGYFGLFQTYFFVAPGTSSS